MPSWSFNSKFNKEHNSIEFTIKAKGSVVGSTTYTLTEDEARRAMDVLGRSLTSLIRKRMTKEVQDRGAYEVAIRGASSEK